MDKRVVAPLRALLPYCLGDGEGIGGGRGRHSWDGRQASEAKVSHLRLHTGEGYINPVPPAWAPSHAWVSSSYPLGLTEDQVFLVCCSHYSGHLFWKWEGIFPSLTDWPGGWGEYFCLTHSSSGTWYRWVRTLGSSCYSLAGIQFTYPFHSGPSALINWN